jgi:hypothetical protein
MNLCKPRRIGKLLGPILTVALVPPIPHPYKYLRVSVSLLLDVYTSFIYHAHIYATTTGSTKFSDRLGNSLAELYVCGKDANKILPLD